MTDLHTGDAWNTNNQPDLEENEGRLWYFLKVTELPPHVTEQELCHYFQDRTQCDGGPVQHVDLISQEETAHIYFTDPNVAWRVVQRSPLTMKGKQIWVELGSTILQECLPEEERTVEIRGLQADDVEIVKLYFENPRKGGGDIEDSQWDDENNVLYIAFTDAKVAGQLAGTRHTIAEQVAQTPHTVLGRELQVNLASKKDAINRTSTVMIEGCDLEKEELYRLYFENPKYGGGDIQEMSVDSTLQIIYITFEDSKVAAKVAKLTHTISGRELYVQLISKDKVNIATVMVKGCDLKNEDLCRMYFENAKYGGGDIEDMSVDEELQAFYITFKDPEGK